MLKETVDLDFTKTFQHVTQPKARMLQHTRGLTGVKQVGDVNAKIPLKPDDIPVSTMHYLDNLHLARKVITNVGTI